jgi:hypothetical protein
VTSLRFTKIMYKNVIGQQILFYVLHETAPAITPSESSSSIDHIIYTEKLLQEIRAATLTRDMNELLIVAFVSAVAGVWRNDDVRVAVAIVNAVARAFIDRDVIVVVAVVRAVASFMASEVVVIENRSGEHDSRKRKRDKGDRLHVESKLVL